MDTLSSLYQAIESFGIHRGGWLFVAILSVIPALVSGNMFVLCLSEVLNRNVSLQAARKPLLANFAVALVSASVIAIATYMCL